MHHPASAPSKAAVAAAASATTATSQSRLSTALTSVTIKPAADHGGLRERTPRAQREREGHRRSYRCAPDDLTPFERVRRMQNPVQREGAPEEAGNHREVPSRARAIAREVR